MFTETLSESRLSDRLLAPLKMTYFQSSRQATSISHLLTNSSSLPRSARLPN